MEHPPDSKSTFGDLELSEDVSDGNVVYMKQE
jgi:hypothetical protein